jgi:hypothetical protein
MACVLKPGRLSRVTLTSAGADVDPKCKPWEWQRVPVYTPRVIHTDRHKIFAAFLLVTALFTPCARPAYAEPTPKAATPNACIQAHTDAQVLRKDGQLVEAREQLLRCAQSECPGVVLDDCAGWLPGLENSIPTAVFAVSDAQGRDIVDARIRDQKGRMVAERSDGRAVPMNPGLYMLEIGAPGYVTVNERVVVRESEKNRIVRVTLQAQPSEAARGEPEKVETSSGMKPIPTASWILGGTALASGIVAGVSGLLYLSAKSDLENTRCNAGDSACENERRDIAARGKTYTTIDQIAGPIAGVSLIAAIIVYAVSDPPDEKQQSNSRLQWTAGASPGALRLQLSGRF